jgi:Family of unknown function (DUF5677)
MTDKPEKEGLNYQVIKPELLNLFEATATLLERKWNPRYASVDSARVIIYQLIKIATNTYQTIVYICADTPKDHERKPSYALSLAPLTRTLFENLITLVFLLEDIPKHITLLMKTGYVERVIELEYCQKYHGSLPEWQEYIDKLKAQIDLEKTELKLTAAEISNPKREIGRWPTPGAMLNKLKKNYKGSPSIDFVEYVNSWLYRELSGQTHLNAHGLIQRGMIFSMPIARRVFGDEAEEKMDKHLALYRYRQIDIAITLTLAMVSEIEGHFRYGKAETAKYLWTILRAYSNISKDFYDTRYAALLS